MKIGLVYKGFTALCLLSLCFALLLPTLGECSETWEAISGDFIESVERGNREEPAELVEIEYDGKIIFVDTSDLAIVADGQGGRRLELRNPGKYTDQLMGASSVYEDMSFSGASPVQVNGAQQITEREYREEQQARRWTNIIEDLALRKIDEKALELVMEYGEAKNAVPPMTGDVGSLVLSYSSYIPKIICRPMYVTDVILQPGELVTGVHPGDPVRWTFVPSQSGIGNSEQIHVLIKPFMADISTNVVINTDKRTYMLDLVSSTTKHFPSVSFSYPADTLAQWKSFIEQKRADRRDSLELSSGYTLAPEDLHLDYEVRGKEALRWKPVRVWDDGVKTYIQFKKGSVKKSVEAPVLVVFEHKKEVLVNYRVAEDMYIVDRIFNSGALIVGTGTAQDRIIIRRLAEK